MMTAAARHRDSMSTVLARGSVIALAAAVTLLDAVALWGRGAPAPSRWVGIALVAAVVLVSPRVRRASIQGIVVLALLAGVAAVNRAIVPYGDDPSPLLRGVEFTASAGMAVPVVSCLYVLSAARGVGTAVLTAVAGAMTLACLNMALSRFPGAVMGYYPGTTYKGQVPDAVLGHAYAPGSTVRSFFTFNSRGYFDGPAPMRRKWRLNLHSVNDSAVLAYPPGSAGIIRIEILRARSGLPYGIQLNEGQLRVKAGTKYLLQFAARADRPRSIDAGVAEWHAPWSWLGYYRTIAVDTAWEQHADTLSVIRDDGNARVHFDLSSDSASVELADMRLRDLTTGVEVDPDSLPFSVPAHFNELGCRGPSVTRATAPTRRILVLGDSYAVGDGVRDEDTFGALLEKELNAQVPAAVGSSAAFEVLVCGAPGWGTRQERLFYGRLHDQYPADVVLATMSWNDAGLAT